MKFGKFADHLAGVRKAMPKPSVPPERVVGDDSDHDSDSHGARFDADSDAASALGERTLPIVLECLSPAARRIFDSVRCVHSSAIPGAFIEKLVELVPGTGGVTEWVHGELVGSTGLLHTWEKKDERYFRVDRCVNDALERLPPESDAWARALTAFCGAFGREITDLVECVPSNTAALDQTSVAGRIRRHAQHLCKRLPKTGTGCSDDQAIVADPNFDGSTATGEGRVALFAATVSAALGDAGSSMAFAQRSLQKLMDGKAARTSVARGQGCYLIASLTYNAGNPGDALKHAATALSHIVKSAEGAVSREEKSRRRLLKWLSERRMPGVADGPTAMATSGTESDGEAEAAASRLRADVLTLIAAVAVHTKLTSDDAAVAACGRGLEAVGTDFSVRALLNSAFEAHRALPRTAGGCAAMASLLHHLGEASVHVGFLLYCIARHASQSPSSQSVTDQQLPLPTFASNTVHP